MGNSSSSSSSSLSPRPPRSPPRPASPPPPPQPRHDAAAALAIDTPKHDTPGADPLPAAISIGLSPPLSISPPRPMAAANGASFPSSLRATPGGFGRGGSPVLPSPRSVASRASTVTSVAEREAQSYFWGRMKEQYQERKTARRQSQLGTAGKLGRPCCLALQSVSLKGTIPPGAQVHIEVAITPGEHEPHNSPLASSFSPFSSLATPPRQPVAHGAVDAHGRVDHVLIPSVTATSSLVITVVLLRRLEEKGDDDDSHDTKQQPQTTIATLRYLLADVTATLRPTELRLTPETHGEHASASRARSPSALVRSPFGGRRQSGSPTPPARSSPPPTAAGGAGADTGAAAVVALPTLGAVWGELTFFDNRTSGVGWVEVVEELGKPVHKPGLLLVTPQTLALLDGPTPTLGCPGYPLVHVTHVEPGHSPRAGPRDAHKEAISTAGASGASGFVTITLSRAEVKAAPGSGHDLVLVVGGEEEAKRWTQVLRRAVHEASFGGGDS